MNFTTGIPKFRYRAHTSYFEIAKVNAAKYNDLDKQLLTIYEGFEDSIDPQRHADYAAVYRAREEAGVVAITFAGMALEAFFYNYAAKELGDTFVQTHLGVS